MKKASIIMAGLACAMIAAAYTNSVPISTNTRAATEKWTAIRFEPALPPTPANAASKFLDGNREWQTVTAAQIGALTNETDDAALAALAAYAAYWPKDATASSWFTFVTNSGAITITGYNIGGGTDVVIPDYINGLPVTAIGENAFEFRGIVSLIAPQTVTSIEDGAFYYCDSLTSISLPQVQTVGAYAFVNCTSLASVSLPQVQTVEDNAFNSCASLTSISLPQVQTVGDSAFGFCGGLTSLYFDDDAPSIGAEIFEGLDPNQVTNYVTNPTATGWGTTLGGMPVVRPPLHADAITLNGDTITEWPVGGGETSIIAPLYDSGTNVTVTSTQSVYSVAVTGAGPVGIDWSGLSLDGTGRAEVTLRLNVTEWGGTNVTFSPLLTFDRTPEILVTGVWEFACSTIDGTTTRVRQTWPEVHEWQLADYAMGVGTGVSSAFGGGVLPSIGTASNNYIRFRIQKDARLVRAEIHPYVTILTNTQATLNLSVRVAVNESAVQTFYHSSTIDCSFYYPNRYLWTVASHIGKLVVYPDGGNVTYTRLYSDNDVFNLHPQFLVTTRLLNANERAAYAAGWRP